MEKDFGEYLILISNPSKEPFPLSLNAASTLLSTRSLIASISSISFVSASMNNVLVGFASMTASSINRRRWYRVGVSRSEQPHTVAAIRREADRAKGGTNFDSFHAV